MIKDRQTLEYISTLQLPQKPAVCLKNDKSANIGELKAGVNYNQIQCFSEDMNEQLKNDVLNSTLLAQLAADAVFQKDAEGKYDVSEWYAKFTEVLHNIGWVIQGNSYQEYLGSGDTFSVEKVLLDILENVVNPSLIKIIQDVIQALKNMSEDERMLKLYHNDIQKNQTGNMGIGACYEKNGNAYLDMASMYLETEKEILKILFFDFSSEDYQLYTNNMSLILNNDVYATVREAVKIKIQDYVSQYVSDIKI